MSEPRTPAQLAAQDNRDRLGRWTEGASHTSVPESDVNLASNTSYEMVQVPVRAEWFEERDGQRILLGSDVQVEVRSTSATEAPVALTMQTGSGQSREYRNFMGQLYVQVDTVTPETVGSDIGNWKSDRTGQQASINAAQVDADKYLIVDDQVWQQASEPVYYILTDGGTDLVPGPARHAGKLLNHAYRADQFDQAREHAISVAKDRGDTGALERTRKVQPSITVHDDSAVLFTIPDDPDEAPYDPRPDTWR